MRREDKFGYGLLLIGVVMPHLIDKISGRWGAAVATSACLVLGITLIVAGHRHREAINNRTGVRRAVRMLATAVLVFAVIGGIAWVVRGKDGARHSRNVSAVTDVASERYGHRLRYSCADH